MNSKRLAEFDEWSSEADKRKKKKKSRWATSEESESAVLSGLPTVIPQGLSKEQEEQYLCQLQIEEITRRLKTGELGIPPNPEDRSPSPEPIYNNEGKRLNTREFRTRKKLEEERHNLVQRVLRVNPDYKPPVDYRPPLIRIHDKVMIPQDDHPEINFVGLLIGPRGNTLRSLEKETGTSIIIRGKGSVKEGKVGHKDGKPLPGQDEPLHAYITANSTENVKKAVKRIKEIIEEGINVPDADNDLRKQQLRELALLNGTLREGDALSKLKQFQEAQTIVTNTILCTICGGAGHISADCKQRRPGESLKEMAMNQPMYNPNAKAAMDNEYMSLMAELGQGSAPPPHPNSIRLRTPLQLPEPSNKLAITGGPWNSGPPPPPSSSTNFSMPPPPRPPSSNQNSSFHDGPTQNRWQTNSAGPMSLPPPVQPPPPPPSSSSWGNAPPSSNSGSRWGDSSSSSSSQSGGHVWSNPPPPSEPARPPPSGSWGNTNGPPPGSNRWSDSGAGTNSNQSWGGSNSASSGNSWGNTGSSYGSGGCSSWSGSGGQPWGGGMMPRAPMPPTPPSYNRWGPGPPQGGMAPPPPPPN